MYSKKKKNTERNSFQMHSKYFVLYLALFIYIVKHAHRRIRYTYKKNYPAK